MGNGQVKVGVTARDLEEKGVAYERGSMLPQVPDYLGYVLGFLLVWLVYTSYFAAVETVRAPMAKIAHQAEVLKERVEVITSSPEVVKPATGAADFQETGSESWWYAKLEMLNRAISSAADYVSHKIYDIFPSSELEEEEYQPAARSRHSSREQVTSF